MIKLNLLLIICIISFYFSCITDEKHLHVSNVLTIITATLKRVTAAQVTLEDIVTNDGGSPFMDRGVCVNLSVNPTEENLKSDKVLQMGAGSGIFYDSFTDFHGNATIHIRTYVKNIVETVKREDKVFTAFAIAA